jgi:hypothetical protein
VQNVNKNVFSARDQPGLGVTGKPWSANDKMESVHLETKGPAIHKPFMVDMPGG